MFVKFKYIASSETLEENDPTNLAIKKLIRSISLSDTHTSIETKLIYFAGQVKDILGPYSCFRNTTQRSHLKLDISNKLIRLTTDPHRIPLELPAIVNCSGTFTFSENIGAIKEHLYSNRQYIQVQNHREKIKTATKLLRKDAISIQHLEEGIVIATLPSKKHPHENHDRACSFMMGNIRVMLVCDGVSSCADVFTGEAAAEHMSKKLQQTLPHSQSIQTAFFELSTFIENNPGVLNGTNNLSYDNNGNLCFGNSGTLLLEEKIKKIEELIINKLNTIRTGIIPQESATTLELCFLFGNNNNRILLTISCGDSQTIIVNKETKSIRQLNANVYYQRHNQYIHSSKNYHLYHHLNPHTIPLQATSNPGSTISGKRRNITTKDISITLCPISNEEDIFIVSDGITDAFNKGTSQWINGTFYSKLNQHQFANYVSDYSGHEPEKDLLLNAYAITEKPDDMTVILYPARSTTTQTHLQ